MSFVTERLMTAISQRALNTEGQPRRVGIEIELAGLSPEKIAQCVTETVGGNIQWVAAYEAKIENTELGDFVLELDAASVKKLGNSLQAYGDKSSEDDSMVARAARSSVELLGNAAAKVVPWEIVSDPIALKDVPRIYQLVSRLHEAGALGTKSGFAYAFGVHLNPELETHDAQEILRHIQAFICLYDFLLKYENVDISRQISPYIKPYPIDYALLVLDDSYQATTDQLILDYLKHNASRNRALDMLPLFKFLCKDLIAEKVDDQLVKSRPTFHYRLPNCEIGQQGWNLDRSVEGWMLIEELAMSDSLQDMSHEYRNRLNAASNLFTSDWAEQVAANLAGV